MRPLAPVLSIKGKGDEAKIGNGQLEISRVVVIAWLGLDVQERGVRPCAVTNR
jgi:hypothetical protein